MFFMYLTQARARRYILKCGQDNEVPKLLIVLTKTGILVDASSSSPRLVCYNILIPVSLRDSRVAEVPSSSVIMVSTEESGQMKKASAVFIRS
jgi:hypothetical protein